MSAPHKFAPDQKIDFQLWLLHFAHLLAMVDGEIDIREKAAIRKIKLEEKIPDWVFDDFEESVGEKTEQQLYREGMEMLSRCTDEEKLSAFVHLYRLSKADDKVHVREVRFLLYSLKATKISFEEVEYAASQRKAVISSMN
ncbi:MAG: TerB family tellurite resistance protein [Bacteroidia bacterium]|nr:TerB family tellurite resistance protein [Bacteroidia bacterium]